MRPTIHLLSGTHIRSLCPRVVPRSPTCPRFRRVVASSEEASHAFKGRKRSLHRTMKSCEASNLLPTGGEKLRSSVTVYGWFLKCGGVLKRRSCRHWSGKVLGRLKGYKRRLEMQGWNVAPVLVLWFMSFLATLFPVQGKNSLGLPM